jgi:hypothetical protein
MRRDEEMDAAELRSWLALRTPCIMHIILHKYLQLYGLTDVGSLQYMWSILYGCMFALIL